MSLKHSEDLALIPPDSFVLQIQIFEGKPCSF